MAVQSVSALASETADRLVISSLETIAVEVNIASINHSTPNPKLSNPGEQGPTKKSVPGDQRRSGGRLGSCSRTSTKGPSIF